MNLPSQRSSLFFPESRYSRYHPNEVSMFEWRATDTWLFTRWASTCLVLAAINSDSRKGLLGHFPSLTDFVGTDDDIFEGALTAIPDLGPPESTRIRMAGGGIYLNDGGEGSAFPENAEERTNAEDRISAMTSELKIPDSCVNIDWLWGNEVADVLIDCGEDEIIVEESMEVYSIPDFLATYRII